MRMTLFAVGVLAAGLAAVPALAADLPNRKQAPAAPVAVPAFVWTGAYAGLNAGYGFGRISKAGAYFDDPAGFVGGGQIGYNYQLPNNVVLGVETDIQYADMKAKVNAVGATAGLGSAAKNDLEWFGTVRPRLGFAFDRTLVYATGGLAYGSQRLSVPGRGAGSNMNAGWTAGGGVEYAFTANLTGKVEGLYVSLAEHNYVPSTPVSTKSGAEFGVVRAGVNYKF